MNNLIKLDNNYKKWTKFEKISTLCMCIVNIYFYRKYYEKYMY